MSTNAKNGLCVPYSVQTTKEKGRGIYCKNYIAKGTTVWRHIKGQFAVYDEHSLKTMLKYLSDYEVKYVLTHIHCMPEFPDYMVWVFDDGELLNHSNQANLEIRTDADFHDCPKAGSITEVWSILEKDFVTLIAARDIKAGEELTLNYNDDPDGPPYYDALCEQYGISWDWL